MTETPQPPRATSVEIPRQTPRRPADTPAPATGGDERARSQPMTAEPSAGWGMLFFASMMLVVVGCYQVILGVTALANSGYYLVGSSDLALQVNFTVWGWAHLVLGALAAAAGFGVLTGHAWARALGIFMAVLSAVVNLLFMAAYPLWSIVVIALDVLIVYAIATHGDTFGSRQERR